METIIELRHELHRYPELSGVEAETAKRIVQFFKRLSPDGILENLGGSGVAVVFSGTTPGSTVLLRAELDALPIQESNSMPYCSTNAGVAHKCGHDGHMAILAAVGRELATERLTKGRVILLFQPAEETGAGAAAVIADPRFAEITPDYVFALHNLPGFPLGHVVMRSGSFASASRGMAIQLCGRTAHAGQPETGLSPALAMTQIIEQLSSLPAGIASPLEVAFATIVGAKLGEKAFGTAPGEAEIWVTLRSETDDSMAAIVSYAEQVVTAITTRYGLEYAIEYSDVFAATKNTEAAISIIRQSINEHAVVELERPFRWSEDFGCFTAISEGAIFGIGSGEETPELHNDNYDFPDQLIAPAAQIFMRIIDQVLAETK
ncbi:MAG: amidohydrolase [Thermodesulfobacteriota bacterium]|nr:amidohydrolase [Thermodesulfobacteriota bacterium]